MKSKEINTKMLDMLDDEMKCKELEHQRQDEELEWKEEEELRKSRKLVASTFVETAELMLGPRTRIHEGKTTRQQCKDKSNDTSRQQSQKMCLLTTTS